MPASSSRLPALLAALAAIGPFSIDAYLPAFPAMAQALGATSLQIQQTLTAYMATFAFMALWHGALSDRCGRRAVIVVSTLLFVFASLVCALAPSIEWLWAGRALQGASAGAGMVVGRAVIRDLYDGAQAQRLMARVMLIFAAAPAVAPLVGGVLLSLAGWRAVFFFLALFGGVLAWMTWRFLPETLPQAARQPLEPVALGRAYVRVFSCVGFALLVVAVGFNFNGFFLYVMSAPVFIMQHLGLGELGFAWLFVPAVIGMMGGSWMSGRVAGRWSQRRAIGAGFAVMLAAGVLNVAYAALFAPALPASVLPVGIYNFGMALAMPSLTLLALDYFPDRRGMAASCQSFVQVGVNALCAGTVAPLLWTTPLTLGLGMSAFVTLGLLCFLGWRARGEGRC
ncbi:multidrug effflux MFS transporter [Pseudothauera nasutitermitis]|uniref:Bcr/CflA family efflux transporter n=1 Tax=Pseudothauera nasutitermitis TaxID=2565930 RepID=A0A4V3WAV8_9RHOO|nr:multidrug effflux MFS transporter [Pseudothauera nasutitermitis]THF60786.1 multidrug effflux MFS transporter [Pseudothauera nasutitermitis]